VKLMGVYDSPEAFSQAMENKRKVNGSTHHSPAFWSDPEIRDYHYMAFPRHQVRLQERLSQNGWEYVKCPMYPCLLFFAKKKALDYTREAHRQLHADVFSMWNCLLCFCREPATLQQSQSQDNPKRLFLSCPKKKCNLFRWADKPLGQKYRNWLQKKEEKLDHPLTTRDANEYPLRGYDIPGPPPPSPRVRCKRDVQRERPLTDYEKQLLREIQDLKSRQEVVVAIAPPPPPKYSDCVQNWQKDLETVACDFRAGLPSDGLF